MFSVAANNYGLKYVSCAAGTVLVGGGFDTSNSASLTLYNSTASGSSWGGYVWNHDTATSHFTRFFAECLSSTGATSSFIMSSTHSIGAIAPCPSGSYVSGGGFASNQNSDPYSAKANGNGWQVYINPATGMNVYAMCVKFS